MPTRNPFDRVFEKQRRQRAPACHHRWDDRGNRRAGVLAVLLVLPLGEQSLVPVTPVIDPTNAGRLALAWSQRVEGTGRPHQPPWALYGRQRREASRDRCRDRRGAVDRRHAARHANQPGRCPGAGCWSTSEEASRFDVGCGTDGSECQPSWHSATGGPGNAVDPGRGQRRGLRRGGTRRTERIPRVLRSRGDPRAVGTRLTEATAHALAASDGVIWDSSPYGLSARGVRHGRRGRGAAHPGRAQF